MGLSRSELRGCNCSQLLPASLGTGQPERDLESKTPLCLVLGVQQDFWVGGGESGVIQDLGDVFINP